nr:efflux RND transporter periplasmic adaptor subunit [bacterium]
MKLQIKYIFLLVLLSSVVLFPALTGCVEDSIGAIDAKTNQTGDKDEHAGHDHAAEDVKVEDEHAGHDNAAEETSHDEEEGIRILPQAFSDAGIVVERLKPRLLSATLELSGTVLPHPKGEGFVGSLMEGRIKEIFVDIGDYVKEGAALCVIESPAVGEAEAAYITAVAELEFVKGDLERHKILVSEGIESKKGLLELEASLLSCSSKVSAAEITLQAYGFNDEDIKMLDSDQFTGGRVTLRSPTSGTVISLDVRSGMRVTPESDLIHIVNMEKLRVHVDIPEQRISEVAKG